MNNEHHNGNMGTRGVTRPIMDMENNNDQKDGHEMGDMQMSKEQRLQMLQMHHMQTLWIYWMLIILGIWMILFPLTFSYNKGLVAPSGGREVWLSLANRTNVMKWSDIMSGLLLVVFGFRSLSPNRPVSLWICCFVGVWLSIAPLIFWSPTAAGYLNDTFIGMLVISLTVLIPGNTGSQLMNIVHPVKTFYPGVDMTLKNAFSEEEFHTISDSSGGFMFGDVPDGIYVLTIAGGMKSVTGIAGSTIQVIDVKRISKRDSLPLELKDTGCYGAEFELSEN